MFAWVIWLIAGVSIILGIIRLVVTAKKKKQYAEQNKQIDCALTETLNHTKQHLKYTRDIKLIYLSGVGIRLLCILTLILLFFLPIFQIKTELFSTTLIKKNFSFYDNAMIMKRMELAYSYPVSYVSNFVIIMGVGLIVLGGIVTFIFWGWRALFNGDKYAFNVYKMAKIYNGSVKFKTNGDGSLVLTCSCIIFQSIGVGLTKTEVSNNFTLCNGVSGYIVFPIICFIGAVGLLIWSYILQKNFNMAIKSDVVELPKTEEVAPQTAETDLSENKEENAPQVVQATPKDEGKDEPTNEEKNE